MNRGAWLGACIAGLLSVWVPGSARPQPGEPADELVTRDQFRSRPAAEEKAEKLRAQGQRVTIERVQQEVRLQGLMIRVFQVWSDAKNVAARLADHGIDSLVINDPIERGYAVAAGAYRGLPRAQQAARQIRELGFRRVSIVPIETTLTRYVVEARRPRPATPEPTPPVVAERAPEGPETPDVLVLGSASTQPLPAYQSGMLEGGEEKAFEIGIDELRVEAGGLTESDQDVDGHHYAHLAMSARWRPHQRWELRAGGRLDGYAQTGAPDFSEGDADYGDTYIRYRGRQLRATLGAQTVIWGRVDEIPPTDVLGVQDLTRLILDDLEDRRRAVPAFRAEWFGERFKLDLMALPDFREAELPHPDSIWHPVDRTDGRLLGVPSTPVLAQLVQNANFGEDTDGSGGAGLRITRTGRSLDYGLTVQHARRSAPYYELDSGIRAALLGGASIPAALASATGPTFVGRHPWTRVVGGDLAWERGGTVWRLEAAWLSDVPATGADLALITTEGVDWVAGVEFFPGDGDARVNLQVAGHHLLDAGAVLDREDVYNLNGEIENVFARGRWRARLRFVLGLDERDVYLGPELSYVGTEPHEFTLGYHYFDGDDGTLGGFHEDHDLVVLGWRLVL